uniref:Sperm microtubule inner protein 4 n=1 Tax=Meleagris gallopavo TaxID=9103 RepID=A0A803XRC9_MELGA
MMILHDLLRYHRETGGKTILSRTFESNEVLTPLQIPSPPTVLQDRYEEFRESLHHCKLPGGTEREHGGIVLPVLSKDQKSPCAHVRGHPHFGSNVFPWPRGLPIEQYYDVTLLKKSDVRMNDDLLCKPPSSLAKPLSLPFPTSHPYQTHISKYAMFPDFRSPEDRDTGTDASSCQSFHSNISCKAFDMVVLRNTRAYYIRTLTGNPYRHEVVSIPFDSLKEALCCSRQHACLQLPKFSEEKDQIYYPNPSKIVAPNSTFRELEHKVSSRTSNILQNIERAQWITTYNRNFTGRGPMNPLILDDYYMKAVGRLTGELGTDVELKETFMSSLSQARPLGGRTARLLQGRRPRESVLQEQQCCHKQAKLPQVSHQQDHYLDAGLPVSKFQKIIDRKQAEALYQGQFSGRPELQSLPESVHSLSCEDLKPKHLDQHTIWANPLSKTVLPQDGNREESKIVLHELWNQEASEPAWRAEDRLRELALPEWIPGSEVARRQTVLLELQDSFSKTAAQKCFHDSINGETKDLRDNINEGRRHEFYGFNAFYFHN